MAKVRDGRVWCEGCRAWFETITAYRAHRPACGRVHALVEARDHGAPALTLLGSASVTEQVASVCRRAALVNAAAALDRVTERLRGLAHVMTEVR
jgi:hypothetical protein